MWAGDVPDDRWSLVVYGDSTGLRYRNKESDPMPIDIAGGKTLEECIFYQGGGITVYTDNIVKVRTYEGFYDYFLANQRQSEQIMMLPIEEVVKDKEYYDKLVNGLALQYNQQIENAPNFLRNAQALQDVNTPAPINFGCTVFPDGAIWTGEGYSVGTADRPPCPVDVPSGKLSFITSATSETHSFVMNGVSATGIGNYISFLSQGEGAYWRTAINAIGKPLTISKAWVVMSNVYSKCVTNNGDIYELFFVKDPASGKLNCIRHQYAIDYLFQQLLNYKGNLTETELKAELAKDIRFRR